MTLDISERAFEDAIERCLLQGSPDALPDVPTGVAPNDVLEPTSLFDPTAFTTTGPGGYHRRVSSDFNHTLSLFPKDVLDFLLATQPASGLNEELERLYRGNLFSVVRQLRYSKRNDNSLDLVLFLNGLPIFTAELKNPLTGQDVRDAIKRYQRDRDPKDPLLAYGRCLAHFAVDADLVYVTTELKKDKTRFLPFNQGKFGGAGNPPVPLTRQGYPTDYLWNHIWSRSSVLDLVRQSGSGKSNSIAWLAHQLSTLHDQDDRRVFDSIVVVTDRRVLKIHPHAIGQKAKIMVEHFAAQVRHKVGGRAKAMVVTRSRLHAVHYKLAIDDVLERGGYPWKALVAFSGTVEDGPKIVGDHQEAVFRPLEDLFEEVIEEIVDVNFDLYKRITDDPASGTVLKDFLFDQYLKNHLD